MKTVSVKVSEKFNALKSGEVFEFFSGFPCYDGVIDTLHSWYGGLIQAKVSDEEIEFTHDMPNGEWDSWYKTVLRCLSAEEYTVDTE